MDISQNIHVYTDGACKGNPGKGGWAYVVVNTINNEKLHEGSGGVVKTTNNRMELTAVLEAFKYLESVTCPASFVFFVDSKYVVDGITSWIVKWKKNGWKTSTKTPVINEDLWQELDRYTHEVFKGRVSWQWVRGHAGDPYNEMVDSLAQSAATNIKQS